MRYESFSSDFLSKNLSDEPQFAEENFGRRVVRKCAGA
jgi:hypothetical protein